MIELGGRTAVVTGAAAGIGRALVERLAAEGMNVVAADHDEPALAAVERELRERGARVLAVPTDVSSGAAVEELAARATREFGALHLAVNNAGVAGRGGPVWTLSENDWAWVLSVNLWGVIHGVRAFVPRLLEHGDEAHVVNVASIAGLHAPAWMAPYATSKHAVVALSEVLARDLAAVESRVRVSVACPGAVRTRFVEDAERHRPERFRDLTRPKRPPLPPSLAGADEDRYIEPAEVAEQIIQAVREERFWVLTHPELAPLARERADDVAHGRRPRVGR